MMLGVLCSYSLVLKERLNMQWRDNIKEIKGRSEKFALVFEAGNKNVGELLFTSLEIMMNKQIFRPFSSLSRKDCYY